MATMATIQVLNDGEVVLNGGRKHFVLPGEAFLVKFQHGGGLSYNVIPEGMLAGRMWYPVEEPSASAPARSAFPEANLGHAEGTGEAHIRTQYDDRDRSDTGERRMQQPHVAGIKYPMGPDQSLSGEEAWGPHVY